MAKVISMSVFCIAVQYALPRLPVYKHFHRHEGEKRQSHGQAASQQLKLDAGFAPQRQPSSLWDIFRITWPLAGGLFLSYCVTLSIFPGVLSEDLESERLGDWYPLLLFALFNAMDFFGKSAGKDAKSTKKSAKKKTSKAGSKR